MVDVFGIAAGAGVRAVQDNERIRNEQRRTGLLERQIGVEGEGARSKRRQQLRDQVQKEVERFTELGTKLKRVGTPESEAQLGNVRQMLEQTLAAAEFAGVADPAAALRLFDSQVAGTPTLEQEAASKGRSSVAEAGAIAEGTGSSLREVAVAQGLTGLSDEQAAARAGTIATAQAKAQLPFQKELASFRDSTSSSKTELDKLMDAAGIQNIKDRQAIAQAVLDKKTEKTSSKTELDKLMDAAGVTALKDRQAIARGVLDKKTADSSKTELDKLMDTAGIVNDFERQTIAQTILRGKTKGPKQTAGDVLTGILNDVLENGEQSLSENQRQALATMRNLGATGRFLLGLSPVPEAVDTGQTGGTRRPNVLSNPDSTLDDLQAAFKAGEVSEAQVLSHFREELATSKDRKRDKEAVDSILRRLGIEPGKL